ncbi:MAG: hypothetical protein K0Q43_50 [Ramlibacter sp.]|jgi:hypothetical protein|nr:hypothetical protein [Ramlibacter sp.]
MRTGDSHFFACKGYALAAVGALAWAAKALQEGEDDDAAHARQWIRGGPSVADAPIGFDVAIQAIGLSSRREQLRGTFLERPAEAMAQLLGIEHALQTEDPGVPGDEVFGLMQSMRAIHLDGAGAASSAPRSFTAREGSHAGR